MSTQVEPAHGTHCHCQVCTAHYAAHMERQRGSRESRYGQKVHLMLQALEGFSRLSSKSGMDDETSLRTGLVAAFATAGFSRAEIDEAVERIMSTAKEATSGNRD